MANAVTVQSQTQTACAHTRCRGKKLPTRTHDRQRSRIQQKENAMRVPSTWSPMRIFHPSAPVRRVCSVLPSHFRQLHAHRWSFHRWPTRVHSVSIRFPAIRFATAAAHILTRANGIRRCGSVVRATFTYTGARALALSRRFKVEVNVRKGYF